MQLRVRAWVCVRACVRVGAPTRGLERARACVCVRIMRACESPCVSVRAPAGAHGCVHTRACAFRRARVCGREGATDVHLVCVERRAVEVPIAHLRRDRESAWMGSDARLRDPPGFTILPELTRQHARIHAPENTNRRARAHIVRAHANAGPNRECTLNDVLGKRRVSSRRCSGLAAGAGRDHAHLQAVMQNLSLPRATHNGRRATPNMHSQSPRVPADNLARSLTLAWAQLTL